MARKRRRKSSGGLFFGFLILFIVLVILVVIVCKVGDSDGSDIKELSLEEQWDQVELDDSWLSDETSDDDTEDNKEDTTLDFDLLDDITAELDLQEPEAESETETDTDTESEQQDNDAADSIAHRRMYLQLNDTEKMIYEQVYRSIADGSNVCEFTIDASFKSALEDTMTRGVYGVYFDYPEFFWFNRSYGYSYYDRGSTLDIKLELGNYEYWDYVLNKDEYISAVQTKAQEIVNLAAQQPTTYDKVKFVHDYLVTHAQYDYVAYEQLHQTVQSASNQQSHTVYGCLVSQLCVCDGYAKTFQMIMNMLGIESEYVEGDAGGAHAWNYVMIDGEAYWMDVTWDDADHKNDDGTMKYPNDAEYAYFCITSDQISRTHSVDVPFETPVCTSVTNNFFHRENCYMEQYSYDGFVNAIESQKDEMIISVQFSSKQVLDEAMRDLFDNHRYAELPYIGAKEIMYSYNEDMYILNIYIQ